MTQSRDKINQAYLEFEAGNYTVAKKRLQSIVDEDVRAHMYLGWLYDQGLGTSEDLEQAEYHYKYLCNLNDINAKYYLAALYQKKGDLQRAIQLYKEAADSGHVSASYWSYAHLSDPSNESRDLEKANIYLRKAASLGHVYAERDLARQEINNLPDIFSRTTARWRYLVLKIKAMIQIVKDPHDLRVR